MNPRKAFFFLLLLALASAATARAQFSVYGTVTVEHVSGIQCLQTLCGSNNGTIDPLGGTGGIFYDLRSFGPARIGIDLRASSTVGNKNAATYFNTARPRIFSALGGVRASFNTPLPRLRPYVEGAVGLAKTNLVTPENASSIEADPTYPSNGRVYYHSGVQFRGFAGVDLSILPAFDFRIVELGAGGLNNSGSLYPVTSLSTGVVFHLPF